MADETAISLGDTLAQEAELKGYKKRFSEQKAFKLLDEWMAIEARNAKRLKQLALWKPVDQAGKVENTRTIPGDPGQFGILIELYRNYREASDVEDVVDRLRLRLDILKQAGALYGQLDSRYDKIIDLIQELLAREDRRNVGADPDEIRRLAEQADAEDLARIAQSK